MPRAKPAHVTIGKILRPRGIVGELKILPLTAWPDRFLQLEQVYVEPRRCPIRRMQVTKARQLGRFFSLKLEGIDTVEDAETLRDGFLLVDRSEVPPLPEGSFYIFDLIGMEVRTETGTWVGEIQDVLELPANDVYVVRNETREILIPAARDIVRRIDLSSGVMIVAERKGLVDTGDTD